MIGNIIYFHEFGILESTQLDIWSGIYDTSKTNIVDFMWSGGMDPSLDPVYRVPIYPQREG